MAEVARGLTPTLERVAERWADTIKLDAPADKLTLARSRQITLEQWQRPRKNPPK